MKRVRPLGLIALAWACAEKPTTLPPAADASSAPSEDAAASADAAVIAPGEDASVIAPGEDASEGPDASAGEDASAGPTPTWCGEVAAIVERKCTLCHGAAPAFGAPMSLTSYAATQAMSPLGVPIHERMALRITAPSSPMPPPNQPRLTQDELATIVRWSQGGAPEGSCATPPDAGVGPRDAEPADAAQPPPNTTPWEIRAHAANDPSMPYELPVDATNYKCWSFVVPQGASQQYAVRFEHLIDNTQHLHHTLIFRDRGNNSPDGPFNCGSPELDWDMVSGWAPGQPDEQMPPGVGVRAYPGDRFVLQTHYDQVGAPGQTDRSGVRMWISDQPGLSEAAVLWAGGAWINDIRGNNVQRQGECTIRNPITIFSIFPHMHKLGTRITLELKRAGTNNWEMVGEVPAWSFNDQPKLTIPMQYQVIGNGDQLRTTCWWDTMGRSVSFGEASDDEMCFNFIMHHPVVPNPTTACLMLLQ